MDSRELKHYGVLGMKWGVRRTKAQLGRKSASEKETDNDDKKEIASSKKSVSDMTDDELNKAVRRLQLEQQYRQLNPQKVSAGKKFVEDTLNKVVVPAVSNAARNLLQKKLEQEIGKTLGVKVDNQKKNDK